MDYFKHYATASDSKSLNAVFDKFGHKGIAFWWMLLELCSENWDGQNEPEFQFHSRTVVTKLKSSSRSVEPWLELCSTLGMIVFSKSSTLYEIIVPKLSEIKTSRKVIKSNKKQLTVYIEENKDIDIERDKEKQERSIKISEPIKFGTGGRIINPDEAIGLWNTILVPQGFESAKFWPGSKLRDFLKFSEAVGGQQDWKDFYSKISKSSWLKAHKSFTFDWFFDESKASKFLNGAYFDNSNKATGRDLSDLKLEA